MKQIFTLSLVILFFCCSIYAEAQQFKFDFQIGADRAGKVQLSGPGGIAGDGKGNIYVVDGGHYRIVVFDTTGHVKSKFGDFSILDHYPDGIAFDSIGNAYIAQTYNIVKYNVSRSDSSIIIGYGTADGKVSAARTLAIHPINHLLYVCDGNRIEVFDTSGNFQFKFGSSASDIKIDSLGNVYLADAVNSRVQVVDGDGNLIRSFGTYGNGNGQFKNLTAIHATNTGMVYATDYVTNDIQVFDSNGDFLRRFGSPGTGTGQFSRISRIWVDHDGTAYVSDDGTGDGLTIQNVNVKVFSNDGTYLKTIGSYGDVNGEFELARNVHVDLNKTISVYDALGRIQMFDSLGNFESSLDLPVNGSYGFTRSRSGKIFLPDLFVDVVDVFDATGVHLFAFGSRGSGNGQLNQPIGITTDAKGKIYVADSKNNRIQIFDSLGNYLNQITGTLSAPYGVAVDSFYNVYVANSGAQNVKVFNSSLNLIKTLGSFGNGKGQFKFPMGIAVNSVGMVYVADNSTSTLQVWDNSGNFLAEICGFGYDTLQLNEPTFLSIDRDDAIYVADQENERVQKIIQLPRYQLTGDFIFPDTYVDSVATVSFTLENPSSQSLTFTSIALPQGFTSNWTGRTLTPGQSVTIYISFKPSEVKQYQGLLKVISSNDIALYKTISGNGITDVVTAISSSNQSANVTLYPNPSNGYISVRSADQIESIEISNSLGETESFENLQNIFTSFKGLVIVKVKTMNDYFFYKLLIE